MDEKIRPLVLALGFIPGIRTLYSCAGHLTPFRFDDAGNIREASVDGLPFVTFEMEISDESVLRRVASIARLCGWKFYLRFQTDGGVKYWLEDPGRRTIWNSGEINRGIITLARFIGIPGIAENA